MWSSTVVAGGFHTEDVILPLRVFVGSSSAQKATASRLADALAASMTPVPWWEAFRPGETTLGNLLQFTQQMDLAIFVIARDDLRWKGGDRVTEAYVTRDNVIYELGLFAGALGGTRSMMFVDSSEIPDKPTDLEGVFEVRWNSKDKKSFEGAIEKIVLHARRTFDELGLGWWAVRFDNDTVPGRATHGVFELVTKGTGLRARYGNTYYVEASHTTGVQHQLRSTWDASSVSFVRQGQGGVLGPAMQKPTVAYSTQ